VFPLGTVGGAGEHLSVDGPLEEGDLFRALVDQENDDPRLSIAGTYRSRNLFQEGRLASLGRGDDEATCALANWRNQIYSPHGEFVTCAQTKALVRIHGDQLSEWCALLKSLRRQTADRRDFRQLWPLLRISYRACDGGSLDQPVLAHELGRNPDFDIGLIRPEQQASASFGARQDASC
jgi:hypothetical protein